MLSLLTSSLVWKIAGDGWRNLLLLLLDLLLYSTLGLLPADVVVDVDLRDWLLFVFFKRGGAEGGSGGVILLLLVLEISIYDCFLVGNPDVGNFDVVPIQDGIFRMLCC